MQTAAGKGSPPRATNSWRPSSSDFSQSGAETPENSASASSPGLPQKLTLPAGASSTWPRPRLHSPAAAGLVSAERQQRGDHAANGSCVPATGGLDVAGGSESFGVERRGKSRGGVSSFSTTEGSYGSTSGSSSSAGVSAGEVRGAAGRRLFIGTPPPARRSFPTFFAEA